jgi:hypothetical protein
VAKENLGGWGPGFDSRPDISNNSLLMREKINSQYKKFVEIVTTDFLKR